MSYNLPSDLQPVVYGISECKNVWIKIIYFFNTLKGTVHLKMAANNHPKEINNRNQFCNVDTIFLKNGHEISIQTNDFFYLGSTRMHYLVLLSIIKLGLYI